MTISVEAYARECAEQGLRGNYAVCQPDFTVEQQYDYSTRTRKCGAHFATARRN